MGDNKSIKDIWDNEKSSYSNALLHMAYLEEKQIDVNELEEVLKEIFANRPDILEAGETSEKTNVRRMIRIYDYLAYASKIKEPIN